MERLRVAAYCRVSTDQSDQLHSLAAQQRYFAEYIAAHPAWENAGVWADEGISGTSTAKRRQFRALMAAAERGEIDLILTKEVSRFARNTVDTLAYTRKLREWGVGVLFLTDNIDTRAGEGEFRLTIMASVAQEESRKTSERVKWGQRRSMERGVVFGAAAPYGYRLADGVLTVQEEQAEVVRRVYRLFLEDGRGTHVVARRLTKKAFPRPRQRETHGRLQWCCGCSATKILRRPAAEKDLHAGFPDAQKGAQLQDRRNRFICATTMRRSSAARSSRLPSVSLPGAAAHISAILRGTGVPARCGAAYAGAR